MAFTRPTLQEIITRVEGDFKSGLGLLTILRRSFLGVIARALAGLAHLLFGFLQYLERQVFVDTADEDNIPRFGAIWGVPQKLATFAEFDCLVTGLVGTIIPINTVYRRSDAVEYTTEAALTLTATPSLNVITLIAVASGAAAAVTVGDKISILSPIAGLDSEATVDVIIIEPEDNEELEAWRLRILDRIRNPPSGGAATDYIQWALAVPGITRAWVGPQALGPGTVVVWVVSDDEDPITPSPAKITEVEDYIEVRRPVTANVSVTDPNLLDLDMTIELKPNTTEVQNNVIAQLEDLILRESALAGAYKSPGVLHDGKILLSRLNEAISLGVGEEDHNITVINGGAPGDVTPATGELIVLGTITWLPLP